MSKLILIKTLILTFLVITPLAYAQELPKQPILDVNLHYKEGAVTLNSVDKREGFLPDYLNQPQEGYTLTVYGQNATGLFTELFRVNFNFPLEIITERLPQQEIGGSVQVLSQADKIVTVPAFENARTLIIANPQDQIVLEHKLSGIVDPKLPERGATKPWSLTFNPWSYLGLLGLLVLMLALVLAPNIIRFIKERHSG